MLNPSSPPCRSVVLLLCVAAALCACQRTETAPAEAAPAPAPADAPAAQVDPAAVDAAAPNADAATALPAGFKEYAVTAFDGDRQCVVGAVSTADAPAQQAYVAVKRAGDGNVLWAQALSGIDGMYQSRATHCAHADGSLQVLLQSDTHSQQTLSQTQLSVARVPVGGGDAVSRYVEVPGTRDQAFSAWVEPGADNFALRDGRLLVRGHYRFNDQPDVERDFEVALAKD